MRALAQEEARARYRLQIPGSFLSQAQEGTLLKLEPASAAAGEIRLVARPSFSLGRSRILTSCKVRPHFHLHPPLLLKTS